MAEYCEKKDECGELPSGISVDECTATIESNLDEMSAIQRMDAERALNSCLALPFCDIDDCLETALDDSSLLDL